MEIGDKVKISVPKWWENTFYSQYDGKIGVIALFGVAGHWSGNWKIKLDDNTSCVVPKGWISPEVKGE
jgi:hypothetical protein